MHLDRRKPPGDGRRLPENDFVGAEIVLENNPFPAGMQLSPRFVPLVEHLHDLGSKPVGELHIEVAGADPFVQDDIILCLERYRRLDKGMVAALGGDHFPPPLHVVMK
jgi:hypothetical protein